MECNEMNICDWISSLSCEELKHNLLKNGMEVGPIGPSVRPLYERKLLRHLTGDKPEDFSDFNGSSPTKVETVTSVKNNQKVTFYAINASSIDNYENDSELIFENKVALMQKLKATPNARFNIFSDYESACNFVRKVEYSPCSNNIKKDQSSEETCMYKSVKRPELNEFRRMIDKGELEKVCEKIHSNPRYLISDVDTPIILQEGSRYNALHTCAISNQFKICEKILKILENKDFMMLLYPKDGEEIRQERTHHILDLYLNMPDKHNGESPLHYACKKGHVDVVHVLCSYPAVDREKINKHGETPKQIICSFCKKSDPELKKKIKVLMETQYYIPILRSEDNSTSAVIGTPWTPESTKCPTPQQSAKSPKDPSLTVKAYAGPMSSSQATQFQQKIKPPSPHKKDISGFHALKRKDSEKGLERICRKIASELHIPWCEYWDFLNSFTNLSTESGLQKLEDYLNEKCKIAFSKMQLNSEIDDIENKMKQVHVSSPEKQNINLPESPSVVNLQSKSILQPSKFNNFNLSFNGSLNNSPFTNSPSHSCTNFCDNPFSTCFNKKTKSKQLFQLPESPSFTLGNNSFLDNEHNSAIRQNRLNIMHTTKDDPVKSNLDFNEYSENDYDSDTSFHTANNDSDMSDMEDEEMDNELLNTTKVFEQEGVFLCGNEPTKLDQDVLHAISAADIITYDDYPCVSLWREYMMSFSESDRACWRTPMRLKTQNERRIEEERTPVRPPIQENAESPPSPSFEEIQSKLMLSLIV